MEVKKAIRENRNAMRNEPMKKRIGYFLQYYGIISLVALAAVALLVVSGIRIINEKETWLQVTYINTWTEENEKSLSELFASKIGLDTSRYEISVDTSLIIAPEDMDNAGSYYSAQRLTTQFAANEIDVILTDSTAYRNLAYQEYFLNLNAVFDSEEISVLEPHLYYIDGAVLAQQNLYQANFEEFTGTYPDPFSPHLMVDPIPVGICLGNGATQEINGVLIYFEDVPIAGIAGTTKRTESAKAFLQYLYE